MMRPVSARRQDVNVSLDKLGEALACDSANAGRMGAWRRWKKRTRFLRAGEPQVRRTWKLRLKTLNDLGVVVYEWNETGPK